MKCHHVDRKNKTKAVCAFVQNSLIYYWQPTSQVSVSDIGTLHLLMWTFYSIFHHLTGTYIFNGLGWQDIKTMYLCTKNFWWAASTENKNHRLSVLCSKVFTILSTHRRTKLSILGSEVIRHTLCTTYIRVALINWERGWGVLFPPTIGEKTVI